MIKKLLITLTVVGTTVAMALTGDIEPRADSLEKRCTGARQQCGFGAPACCDGLFCDNRNQCTSCNTWGTPCNNLVPCCQDLFCSNDSRCFACNRYGENCGNGIPCCKDLYCSNRNQCFGCNGWGAACDNGIPCCKGLSCSFSSNKCL